MHRETPPTTAAHAWTYPSRYAPKTNILSPHRLSPLPYSPLGRPVAKRPVGAPRRPLNCAFGVLHLVVHEIKDVAIQRQDALAG